MTCSNRKRGLLLKVLREVKYITPVKTIDKLRLYRVRVQASNTKPAAERERRYGPIGPIVLNLSRLYRTRQFRLIMRITNYGVSRAVFTKSVTND